MSDKDKLAKIVEMIEAWNGQPDPEPGDEESIEAADVLFEILKVAEQGT